MEVFGGLPWLKVLVEQIELPHGRIVDDFYRVCMPESVLVPARAGDGRLEVERT